MVKILVMMDFLTCKQMRHRDYSFMMNVTWCTSANYNYNEERGLQIQLLGHKEQRTS